MKTIFKNITKINQFLNLKTTFLIIVIVLANSKVSFAQNKITSLDEKKIKLKAAGIISDLANKYNQLLEADTEDRNRMIDIMTLPGTDNFSIFESDQIIIEDDFTTRRNTSNDIPTKRVDIYINDICRNYGKKDNGEYLNEGKLVTITNIIPSKVLATSPQAPLFIKIFFEVNYEGIDDRTKLAFKQPAYRVAEFTISKPKNIWSVAINAIRFSKGEQENDKNLEKNVTIIPVESKDALEDMIIEEKKTVFRNPLLQAYKSEGKWGLVNLDDNDKILTKPIYDFIDEFTEDGLALVNKEGLWGYIDYLEGKIVINCEYDNADPFSKEKKGRARVYKGLENYLIDKNGIKTK
jgi:WG containing repeat